MFDHFEIPSSSMRSRFYRKLFGHSKLSKPASRGSSSSHNIFHLPRLRRTTSAESVMSHHLTDKTLTGVSRHVSREMQAADKKKRVSLIGSESQGLLEYLVEGESGSSVTIETSTNVKEKGTVTDKTFEDKHSVNNKDTVKYKTKDKTIVKDKDVQDTILKDKKPAHINKAVNKDKTKTKKLSSARPSTSHHVKLVSTTNPSLNGAVNRDGSKDLSFLQALNYTPKHSRSKTVDGTSSDFNSDKSSDKNSSDIKSSSASLSKNSSASLSKDSSNTPSTPSPLIRSAEDARRFFESKRDQRFSKDESDLEDLSWADEVSENDDEVRILLVKPSPNNSPKKDTSVCREDISDTSGTSGTSSSRKMTLSPSCPLLGADGKRGGGYYDGLQEVTDMMRGLEGGDVGNCSVEVHAHSIAHLDDENTDAHAHGDYRYSHIEHYNTTAPLSYAAAVDSFMNDNAYSTAWPEHWNEPFLDQGSEDKSDDNSSLQSSDVNFFVPGNTPLRRVDSEKVDICAGMIGVASLRADTSLKLDAGIEVAPKFPFDTQPPDGTKVSLPARVPVSSVTKLVPRVPVSAVADSTAPLGSIPATAPLKSPFMASATTPAATTAPTTKRKVCLDDYRRKESPDTPFKAWIRAVDHRYPFDEPLKYDTLPAPLSLPTSSRSSNNPFDRGDTGGAFGAAENKTSPFGNTVNELLSFDTASSTASSSSVTPVTVSRHSTPPGASPKNETSLFVALGDPFQLSLPQADSMTERAASRTHRKSLSVPRKPVGGEPATETPLSSSRSSPSVKSADEVSSCGVSRSQSRVVSGSSGHTCVDSERLSVKDMVAAIDVNTVDRERLMKIKIKPFRGSRLERDARDFVREFEWHVSRYVGKQAAEIDFMLLYTHFNGFLNDCPVPRLSRVDSWKALREWFTHEYSVFASEYMHRMYYVGQICKQRIRNGDVFGYLNEMLRLTTRTVEFTAEDKTNICDTLRHHIPQEFHDLIVEKDDITTTIEHLYSGLKKANVVRAVSRVSAILRSPATAEFTFEHPSFECGYDSDNSEAPSIRRKESRAAIYGSRAAASTQHKRLSVNGDLTIRISVA